MGNSKYVTIQYLFLLRELHANHILIFAVVDSWGKLPEGMLSGHVNSYGDYDECVGVEVDDDRGTSEGGGNAKFSGQYCWTYIIPGSLAAEEGGQAKGDFNDDRISTRKAGSVDDLLVRRIN